MNQLFCCVDQIAVALLRRELLTINIYCEQQMELERIFSSNLNAYPLGGRKQKKETQWGRHVLINKETFIGEGSEAIQQSFNDHALILELGLQSVINVPIAHDQICLGTLNILMKQIHVKPNQIECAEHLAGLLRYALIHRQTNTYSSKLDLMT